MGKNIGKGLILGEVFDQIHKIAWFHCGAHDVDPNDRINITLTYMTTQAQKTLTIGKIPTHGNCRQWQGFKIWICKPRWTMTNPQTSKHVNNQHQDIVWLRSSSHCQVHPSANIGQYLNDRKSAMQHITAVNIHPTMLIQVKSG
jgi:hypothetical protein